MGVYNNARSEIIRKAVLEKLSEGINFFSADDILTVAGIDDAQLKKISDSIKLEAVNAQEGRRKTAAKKK